MTGHRFSRVLVALVTTLMAPAAFADDAPPFPSPVLTDAAARDGIDLDGTWHYSIDPYRDGLAGFHRGEAGQGHRRYDDIDVEKAMATIPPRSTNTTCRARPPRRCPGSWLTYAPEMRHYQGLVWYQRTFKANVDKDQRAFLRFGAANYTARVYLNGKFVGEHEGGFTPFAFEVTKLLRDGDNQVTVGVDSTRTDQSVPPPVTDWETYGGITRPVKLVVVPDTFIDDFWIRLTRDGRIAATVTLNGPKAANRNVSVAIDGLDASIDGITDAQRHLDWRHRHAGQA